MINSKQRNGKSHRWVKKPEHIWQKFLNSILVGCVFICIALGIGIWGYHTFEGMKPVDAFVNAAMILSGMGPLSSLNTNAGKIFAGCYALFSGLGFILIIGIIFAPLVHLFFHRIHVPDEE